MAEKSTLPTSLSGLISPKTRPSTTRLSPFSAVKRIDDERTKREYANFTTLDLLGLEEEYDSRIQWLRSLNRVIPETDRRNLDAIRAEMVQPTRTDLVASRYEFEKRNKWRSLYPESGPFRRELYQKHLDIYKMGATSNERLLLGSNRSGKTVCGAYETTCHVTGIYPDWWEGRRFIDPIHCWIVNKGAKEVRDINEQELLGPSGNLAMRGTGMLPGHRIVKCTPKSGTPNATEFIDVKHVSGGISRIQSKSFDQGREAFQGTAIPFIWGDEECPDDVYGEMVMRIMTVNGLVLLTYTPILGLTPLTTEFLQAAGIEIEGQPLKTQEPVHA